MGTSLGMIPRKETAGTFGYRPGNSRYRAPNRGPHTIMEEVTARVNALSGLWD
jgi:hypothetical protein